MKQSYTEIKTCITSITFKNYFLFFSRLVTVIMVFVEFISIGKIQFCLECFMFDYPKQGFPKLKNKL